MVSSTPLTAKVQFVTTTLKLPEDEHLGYGKVEYEVTILMFYLW